MTREQFYSIPRQEGVDERAYTLDGRLPSERYVLEEQRGGGWTVYYSERGRRSGLRAFKAEAEALEHMLQKLLSDSSTRTVRRPQAEI